MNAIFSIFQSITHFGLCLKSHQLFVPLYFHSFHSPIYGMSFDIWKWSRCSPFCYLWHGHFMFNVFGGKVSNTLDWRSDCQYKNCKKVQWVFPFAIKGLWRVNGAEYNWTKIIQMKVIFKYLVVLKNLLIVGNNSIAVRKVQIGERKDS